MAENNAEGTPNSGGLRERIHGKQPGEQQKESNLERLARERKLGKDLTRPVVDEIPKKVWGED